MGGSGPSRGLAAAPASGQVRGQEKTQIDKGASRWGGQAWQGVSEPGFWVAVGGLEGDIVIYIIFPTEYLKTYLQPRLGTGDCVPWRPGPAPRPPHPAVPLYPKTVLRLLSSNKLHSPCKLLCCLEADVARGHGARVPYRETLRVKFIQDRTSSSSKSRGFFHTVGNMVQEQDTPGLTATVLQQGSSQNIHFFVMKSPHTWLRENKPNTTLKPLIGGFSELSRAQPRAAGPACRAWRRTVPEHVGPGCRP